MPFLYSRNNFLASAILPHPNHTVTITSFIIVCCSSPQVYPGGRRSDIKDPNEIVSKKVHGPGITGKSSVLQQRLLKYIRPFQPEIVFFFFFSVTDEGACLSVRVRYSMTAFWHMHVAQRGREQNKRKGCRGCLNSFCNEMASVIKASSKQ